MNGGPAGFTAGAATTSGSGGTDVAAAAGAEGAGPEAFKVVCCIWGVTKAPVGTTMGCIQIGCSGSTAKVGRDFFWGGLTGPGASGGAPATMARGRATFCRNSRDVSLSAGLDDHPCRTKYETLKGAVDQTNRSQIACTSNTSSPPAHQLQLQHVHGRSGRRRQRVVAPTHHRPLVFLGSREQHSPERPRVQALNLFGWKRKQHRGWPLLLRPLGGCLRL
mmetsp:Transcript_65716/g.137372  ORF Transcript_65716/g.137372 Transcript_65716/m.137372 type:complete len:220 (-) Transcript_65716:228-887(-)